MEIKNGTHTTRLPDSTPVMTYEEWKAEGTRRFGEDVYHWKFKCPICGNVASIKDFEQYKEQGSTPDSATQECIGRYNGSKFEAFPREGAKQGKPCNYALFGLFRLPGVIVTGSPYAPNGKDRMAFAFAEET